MKDKSSIIEMIKQRIKSEYQEDVAIFATYGSYVRGTQDDKSDIDFFFIPKTEKAYELSFQFIIDGIGYDLFPISWERVVKIAAFDQPLTSVIADAKLIYFGTQEDKSKFEAIQKGIRALCSPQGEEMLIHKAFEYFNEAYLYLYNMRNLSKDIIDARIEGAKIISKVAMAVAFANQTYYRNGMGAYLQESFQLNKLPKEYQKQIDLIVEGSTIESILLHSEGLIQNTRIFLFEVAHKNPQVEPYETLFVGYYEELKSVLNKVSRACEHKDGYTAYMTVAYLHEEVAQFIAKCENGNWYNDRNIYHEYSEYFTEYFKVDLLALAAEKKFEELQTQVNTFEEKLVTLLKKQGVSIKSYGSIEEFESDYLGR